MPKVCTHKDCWTLELTPGQYKFYVWTASICQHLQSVPASDCHIIRKTEMTFLGVSPFRFNILCLCSSHMTTSIDVSKHFSYWQSLQAAFFFSYILSVFFNIILHYVLNHLIFQKFTILEGHALIMVKDIKCRTRSVNQAHYTLNKKIHQGERERVWFEAIMLCTVRRQHCVNCWLYISKSCTFFFFDFLLILMCAKAGEHTHQ